MELGGDMGALSAGLEVTSAGGFGGEEDDRWKVGGGAGAGCVRSRGFII